MCDDALTPRHRLRLARLVVEEGWTVHSPTKTPRPIVKRIIALRWRKRMGTVEIVGRLNVPASTVHAVLVRARLSRLSHVDVRTREPVRRYEHDHPAR